MPPATSTSSSGGRQVVLPTALLIQANGDPVKILAASGLCLFGFTYLYVGLNLLTGADSTAAGWYSLFVAITAVGFSAVSFIKLDDAPFGVIWLYWAFLWFLFFLLLGLKRDSLGTYTGYVTVVEGWVTATIPGFLLFTGYWRTDTTTAGTLAAIGVVMAVGLWLAVAAQSAATGAGRGRPAAVRRHSQSRRATAPSVTGPRARGAPLRPSPVHGHAHCHVLNRSVHPSVPAR